MRRSVVTGRTIYEDPRLTLSSVAVTLRGYWLPFGTSRAFRLTDLTSLTRHARGDGTFDKWPRWGRRGEHTWFPLDASRPRRDVAIALHHPDGRRTVVTPSNPARLAGLLVELGVNDATPPIEGAQGVDVGG